MKLQSKCVALGACVLVAACGGGGGGFEPPPTPPVASNEVPTNATTSIANFVSYLNTTAVSDTAEPVGVNQTTPPSSETDEPLAVI